MHAVLLFMLDIDCAKLLHCSVGDTQGDGGAGPGTEDGGGHADAAGLAQGAMGVCDHPGSHPQHVCRAISRNKLNRFLHKIVLCNKTIKCA